MNYAATVLLNMVKLQFIAKKLPNAMVTSMVAAEKPCKGNSWESVSELEIKIINKQHLMATLSLTNHYGIMAKLVGVCTFMDTIWPVGHKAKRKNHPN